MDNFIESLEKVRTFIKNKEFDLAYSKANKYMFLLLSEGNSSWYMMYRQMADILAREKRWEEALKNMSFTFHYLGRVGGITHQKFVLRLLNKIGKSKYYDEFVAISTDPDKEIDIKTIEINKLLQD